LAFQAYWDLGCVATLEVVLVCSGACSVATLGPETLASEVDWWVALTLVFELRRWLEVPACPAWSVAGADGCWLAFAGQLLASIVDFWLEVTVFSLGELASMVFCWWRLAAAACCCLLLCHLLGAAVGEGGIGQSLAVKRRLES